MKKKYYKKPKNFKKIAGSLAVMGTALLISGCDDTKTTTKDELIKTPTETPTKNPIKNPTDTPNTTPVIEAQIIMPSDEIICMYGVEPNRDDVVDLDPTINPTENPMDDTKDKKEEKKEETKSDEDKTASKDEDENVLRGEEYPVGDISVCMYGVVPDKPVVTIVPSITPSDPIEIPTVMYGVVTPTIPPDEPIDIEVPTVMYGVEPPTIVPIEPGEPGDITIPTVMYGVETPTVIPIEPDEPSDFTTPIYKGN